MDISAIRSGFDASSGSYDQARRQLIPCFDEYYGCALSLIPFQPDDSFRVLDLGAGTGLLSALVLERFPQAKLTLVDIAGAMLDKARERFAAAADHCEFVVADYASAPLPGQFDLVISALSIHHLTDALKRQLFQRVYAGLPSGGMFINADQALGATPELEQIYRDTWVGQVRNRGASDATLAAALERMKEDRMATLANQLAWLEEAGFRQVDCWYKNYSFIVYSGVK
ncbi:MAG: methylase involved in ubiquinone/menaquinone biosynthesis [Burkholderiaceae bacterium]|nr:methylase involved in ubiquinone/menaquinone biosynthesis [Burkholderiaceae bacterium]